MWKLHWPGTSKKQTSPEGKARERKSLDIDAERPDPRTPEMKAAAAIISKFDSAKDTSVALNPEDYPAFVAAARSEPDVLRGVIARVYNNELFKARESIDPEKVDEPRELEQQDAIAHVQALVELEEFGFTEEEVKPILDTLHP